MRLLALVLFCAAAMAALCPAPSMAQEDGDQVSIGVYRKIHSEALGEDRLLAVSLPEEYGSSAMSYPVLYVLYGDQIRGYYAEAVHAVNRLSQAGEMPGMIVVGVVNVDRYADLRSIPQEKRPSRMGQFKKFFAEELIPFIDREYRTKDYRVVIGPQAGSVFSFHDFLGGSVLFDAYIIENPFYWSGENDALIERAAALLDKKIPSRIFIQMTCVDRTGIQDHSEAVDYARRLEEMAARSGNENLELVALFIEDNPDFVPSPRTKDGLRRLFSDYSYPAGQEAASLADYVSYYDELSKRFGVVFEVPELPLVLRADELPGEGKAGEAIEILQYIIDKNPVSVNAHWRLANLYRAAGERDKAIAAYRKCLELMPNFTPARRILEQLEAGGE